ncbi:hypothetical protein [Lignipirellula cremea]|uniref:Uncharacterized protein n=1 Tax=Lignipirellula cremea TaxID=2528010 RepID=A0A518DYX9_9BACT|nr:hypothetical protein [Lignipirellula cremea]QDU97050.1 hypothetical protein Pla8534_48760 [Lignipirellula cremea]
MTQRVKCAECDNMILPQTAADNDGLCAQCVKISPELRAEKREYERQLAEGLVFTPSPAERANSKLPPELANGQWQLQPEYYAERNFESAMDAIIAAKTESGGNVFLVTDDGGQLNLGFTDRYGVCEYQNQDTGDFRYAYTKSNLREQVPEELHVVQACPCCGVGMLWYPSRYHMPRDRAFSLLENAVSGCESPGVEWLETDDFSYTEHGRG